MLPYKQKKFFPIPLDQRLQQLLKKKQQWVLCWKNRIYKNEKQAKIETTNKTSPIRQYFTTHKKPKFPSKQNRYHERDRAMQHVAKNLYDQPIYALLFIADGIQSTSCLLTEQSHSNPNIKQPIVLHHFNCLPNWHPPPASLPYICRIFDWFPLGCFQSSQFPVLLKLTIKYESLL